MKFLHRKHIFILIIFIVVFGLGFYIQKNIFGKDPIYLRKLDISQIGKQTENQKIIQQKTYSMNVYTGMHINFIYPTNIKLKQINPKLISLNDPSIKADDDILYIYSTVVPENIINFKIPFTIPGTLKHSSIIKMHGFVANQETYSDGKNEVNLLVLRKQSQTIVLRIPRNSKPLEETITDVVNSLKTLK